MTEPTVLVYAAAVVVLAYIVRGLAGFGSGLIAVPLLSMIAPVTAVVPVGSPSTTSAPWVRACATRTTSPGANSCS